MDKEELEKMEGIKKKLRNKKGRSAAFVFSAIISLFLLGMMLILFGLHFLLGCAPQQNVPE